MAAGGYDTRTVPFEYVRTDVMGDAFKHFHGERVEAVQVMGGVGYDCGDNCSIRLMYSVVETALNGGGVVSPVSLAATYQFAGIEFNASIDDTVQTLDISWERDGMEVAGGVTWGATDLDNGAPMEFPGSYTQAGAPDKLYGFSVTWDAPF